VPGGPGGSGLAGDWIGRPSMIKLRVQLDTEPIIDGGLLMCLAAALVLCTVHES